MVYQGRDFGLLTSIEMELSSISLNLDPVVIELLTKYPTLRNKVRLDLDCGDMDAPSLGSWLSTLEGLAN